jgi:hypothetical protein
MNPGHLKEFPGVPTLVRKYQAPWEVCLVKKKCSYYWLKKSSLRSY